MPSPLWSGERFIIYLRVKYRRESRSLSALPLPRTGLLVWGCSYVDAADFSHSRQFPVKTEDGNLPGKYKVGSTAHGAASFLEITFLVFRVKAVWWLGDEYRGGDTFVLNLATQNTLSEYVT